MSEKDHTSVEDPTLVERIELCEQGLTAIETILRVTFPKFFVEPPDVPVGVQILDPPEGANDNGEKSDTDAAKESGEGPGEAGKEACGEEKTE